MFDRDVLFQILGGGLVLGLGAGALAFEAGAPWWSLPVGALFGLAAAFFAVLE
jgi:hypothetical protein